MKKRYDEKGGWREKGAATTYEAAKSDQYLAASN